MNRQQSTPPPLPESLGIIVREYLKAMPERPRVWQEPRGHDSRLGPPSTPRRKLRSPDARKSD